MKTKIHTDFDQWYAEQAAQINQLPISSVHTRRDELKVQLENLHNLMREGNLTDERRKYYKGRRKFITRLISHTNERIKLFNIVAHNGVAKNLALRFVQIAAEELPQGLFQRIYAISAMEEEQEESSIEDIRRFIAEFKDRFELEGI